MGDIMKAALYERVSTDEQAKFGYSIKTQIDALEEYCTKNGHKIVDHYTDDGVSGGKPAFKRPAMSRLLEDVKTGAVNLVLFTRLDRWFRNVKEYFKVQEILDAHGVEWKAIWEDYNTTTANGRMAITIFMAIHQNEREKGAERVSAVLENKRKNREACFGGKNVPLGYKKEPDEDGVVRLVKDPETQQAVQEFWDVLLSSNNLNKAIRHMGTEYGIFKDWKSWKRLTQSDFYSGEHRGVKDYCPAYVSREDFEAFKNRKTIKTTPSGSVYYFRGQMRCPDCGAKLCGERSLKSYGVYKAYRCPTRSRNCNNHTGVSEKKIEKQLLDRLNDFLAAEIATVEFEQQKPKEKPKVNVSALKERLRRLTLAYTAGNMSDDEYMKEADDLKAAITKAEQDTPPPVRNISPLKELMETDFQSIYTTLTDDGKQRFWQGLIKEIHLDGKQITDVLFF